MTPRRQRRLVEPSSNRQESHRNSCREVKRSFFSLTSSTSGLGKPKAGRPHFGISTLEFPCGGSDHEHHRRQDASPTTATASTASLFAGSTLPDLPRRHLHRRHVFVRGLKSIPALPADQQMPLPAYLIPALAESAVRSLQLHFRREFAAVVK